MTESYSLSVGPLPVEECEDDKVLRVRYTIPGLGFACEKKINEEIASLLKVAIEQGKNDLRAELQNALGLKNS